MNAKDLVELQRVSLQMLNHHILDPKVLEKRCPLDNGSHTLQPKCDLGALSKVPLEMQHNILGEIDVQSLLNFRRVNQSAMVAVDRMVEYQKVMDHAANCVRMAVAIETSHTFTIKQLCSKLCQKHCDGKDECGEPCRTLAPFLDVFTLTRRCLSIAGGCTYPQSPVCVFDLTDEGYTPEPDLLPARKFKCIPGTYGKEQWKPGHVYDFQDSIYFYDYLETREAMLSDGNAALFDMLDEPDSDDGSHWKLCSVYAPWMNKKGSATERGVFCEICRVEPDGSAGGHSFQRGASSIREAKEYSDEFSSSGEWYLPDPMQLNFMTISDLEQHVVEQHREDVGSRFKMDAVSQVRATLKQLRRF